MAGSLVREDWADKCSLCFDGFACKLAVSLANGIKINVHSITLLCLCLNYVWTLHFLINQNIEVVFHRTQRGWKLKLCVKLSSCEVRRLKQFISCNILQLHVNRLVQFASFCSFLPTFLIFFTGRLWIMLACLREFSTYQRWSKCTFISYSVRLELRSASESIRPV